MEEAHVKKIPFDDVFEYIGSFGPYQLIMYCLIGACAMSNGWQIPAANYLAYVQNHWCDVPQLQNFSFDMQKYISVPGDLNAPGNFRKCEVFDLDYSAYTEEEFLNWNRSLIIGNPNMTTRRCNSWVYDKSVFVDTAASEYDLVCVDAYKVPLLSTVYIGGQLVGAVTSGAVSDRIGRLKTIIGSEMLELVFGILGAFSPNYVLFCISRFGVGACTLAGFTTGFVTAIEMMGLRYRPKGSLTSFYGIASCLLSGFAFAVRDFRKLQLILTCPMILWISYIWIVPESPRWLVIKGRTKEAKKILQKMALINGKELPDNIEIEKPKVQLEKGGKKPSLIDVFRYPRQRIRAINIFFNWLVNSVVYFGLSLNTQSLAGSIFFNTFLNGFMELPAWFFAIFMLDRIGRRWGLALSELLAGVSMLAVAVLINYPHLDLVRTIVSVIGKLGISASFVIVYIFSAELFPTSVRNVCVGGASTFSRIGGMLSPLLARLDLVWKPLPSVIFASFAISGGLLTFLLPETVGTILPATLEDGEQFGQKVYETSTIIEEKKGIPTDSETGEIEVDTEYSKL